MGRDATISYDDVATAATAITGEGGKPTLRAIRERIGRGSLGTIQDHYRRWREGLGRQQLASHLPPALEQAILAFASDESARVRTGLQADMDAAQQTAGELAQDNDRLTEVLEQQSTQLDAMKTELAKLTGQVEQMQSQLEVSMKDSQAAIAAERERAEAARLGQSAADTRAAVATEKAVGLAARLGDFELRLREESQRNADVVAKLEAELREWRDGTRVATTRTN